jgi:hypothetical protein
MSWNNDWRDELEKTDYNCYMRLCECRNTRNDVIKMAKLVKKYNPAQSAEECLIYMMEWVGDWNGQFMVTDFTRNEYNDAIAKIDLYALNEYKDI